MSAETLPILAGALRDRLRSLLLWALALAAISAMYISFYPAMGDSGIEDVIAGMPEDLVVALGYDRIGSAAGWITSTVYALMGPALLLVFAVATGARLIAGEEEDGSLELELTSPASRRSVYIERLLALWISLLALVVVVTAAVYVLVLALDMEVGLDAILATSLGLYLFVTGMGTIAIAVGAATGRRTLALGLAAASAVGAFVLDAIGPVVEAGWMDAVSPFSWYIGHDPLAGGSDPAGLVLLAALPVVFGVAGLVKFTRRDLMV